MLSIISAPASAPQTTVPPPPQPRPAPRLDDTDREIISLVREHGPVKIWTVLDRVAESKGAQSRVEARSYRLRLWHYWVKRLMWLKLIYPVGRNELVAVKPDTRSTRRGPRRRKPSVARLPHVQGGSAINPEAQAQELETKHPVGSQVDKREKPRPSAPADLAETESDNPARFRPRTAPSAEGPLCSLFQWHQILTLSGPLPLPAPASGRVREP